MNLTGIHTSSIIKELPTERHILLLIVSSDYKKYVAKNDKGKEPPYSLINQCLGSFCFNH